MNDVNEVVFELEKGLDHINNAKMDARHLEGIEGIVAYEELDRLETITKMALEKVKRLWDV